MPYYSLELQSLPYNNKEEYPKVPNVWTTNKSTLHGLLDILVLLSLIANANRYTFFKFNQPLPCLIA